VAKALWRMLTKVVAKEALWMVKGRISQGAEDGLSPGRTTI
jgi:hypothetical protein